MHIDRRTFEELEIFETQKGRPGLFERLDRAKTSVGRRALRRRFERPLSEPAAIRAVQEALRFFTEHGDAFERLPGERDLARWADYLTSNVIVASERREPMLAYRWFVMRWRARDAWQELQDGVCLTIRLVAQLSTFREQILALSPPAYIRLWVDEMAAILGHAEIAEVARGELPRGGCVLALDRRLRGDCRGALERLIELLGEFEALRAMAQANREMGWPFPEIERGDACVTAMNLYHPFVANVVPNDLQLGGSHSLLFLTGANMAGKTTLLKACALAVYLAHLGMGVPATGFRTTPFDALFSGLGVEDDLQAGISYYQAETQRVRQLTDTLAAHRCTFAVYDELFKGTNVQDARDACRQVIIGLARSRVGLFVVASHLIELGEELQAEPHIGFAYFEAILDGDTPTFDFRLREGRSAQRLGMIILRREGVLDQLARLALGAPRELAPAPDHLPEAHL